MINYLKNFKSQNNTLTKIFAMWQDINYRKLLLKKKPFFESKLADSIGESRYLWKALRSLALRSKTSLIEVSALKTKNTVEHDLNSV